MQLAGSINSKLVEKVHKSLAEEEHIHLGEFLGLVQDITTGENKFLPWGAKEVEEVIKDWK